MARRIQVATLSDSRLFREALSSRLALEDEVNVVCSAATIFDLLTRAQGHPIEILLVAHLTFRPGRTVEVVWDVKTLLPATRMIVLGVLGCEQDKADTVRWVEAGAMAWLGQDTTYESLLEVIRAVSEGRIYGPPDLMTQVASRIAQLQQESPKLNVFRQEPLTEEESAVALWVRLGLSNKAIARQLGVGQENVKACVSKVLRKLGERRWDLDLRRGRRNV